jgi:hypothetical protein
LYSTVNRARTLLPTVFALLFTLHV